MPRAKITKDQTKTLRSLASRVFPDDDDYRAWLDHCFPNKRWSDKQRPSTPDLTQRQADQAIRDLMRAEQARQQRGERPPQRKQRHPYRGRYMGTGRKGEAAHATQKQCDEIARLEYDYGWQNGTPDQESDRLLGFIRRQTRKRKSVAMLTLDEASSVITGLRKLPPHEL